MEKIEGEGLIEGSLTIRITKVLNAEAGKTEDLQKREGNPSQGRSEFSSLPSKRKLLSPIVCL